MAKGAIKKSCISIDTTLIICSLTRDKACGITKTDDYVLSASR